jgi:hypothetical protein
MVNLKHLVIVSSFFAIEVATIKFGDSEFCDFFETKNITSGEKLESGSILFDGVLYPEGYYRTYNYTVQGRNGIREPASPHIRGCLCKLKICVRICPRSDDYTASIVAFRDEKNHEIDLNEFGAIKALPIFDDSKEFLVLIGLGNTTSWIISQVFKLIPTTGLIQFWLTELNQHFLYVELKLNEFFVTIDGLSYKGMGGKKLKNLNWYQYGPKF